MYLRMWTRKTDPAQVAVAQVAPCHEVDQPALVLARQGIRSPCRVSSARSSDDVMEDMHD